MLKIPFSYRCRKISGGFTGCLKEALKPEQMPEFNRNELFNILNNQCWRFHTISRSLSVCDADQLAWAKGAFLIEHGSSGFNARHRARDSLEQHGGCTKYWHLLIHLHEEIQVKIFWILLFTGVVANSRICNERFCIDLKKNAKSTRDLRRLDPTCLNKYLYIINYATCNQDFVCERERQKVHLSHTE